MWLRVQVGIEGERGEFGIQGGRVELGLLFGAVTLWVPADLQNRQSFMAKMKALSICFVNNTFFLDK